MDTIDNLISEWKSLQPLKEEYQNRLDRKFMLEFNYNSNHIEGNTLTYGQTEFLLLFGRVVDNANMQDLEEMKASNVCLNMVKVESMDKEHHLTEYFIRSLHKTLLREDYTVTREAQDGMVRTYTVHAGIYKTRPNSVLTKTGQVFEYASPEETPALMFDLLQWYNKSEEDGVLSPIELASLFHYRFIRIHPFEDGNGRISRLIVNYILGKHGYPMIVVKSSDKNNYLNSLNLCDVITGPVPCDGAHASIQQLEPLVSYLSQCLERSLRVCIKAAKGESIEDPDDFAKQLGLIEKSVRKKIPLNTGFDPVQEKINVFNFFHRALASKLIAELQPVNKFFDNVNVQYFMSKQKSWISIGGFFALNAEATLSKDLSANEIEIIKEARSIMFQINFSGVKIEYNMQDIILHVDASVQFDVESYCFDDEQYPYGIYPGIEIMESFISKKKNDVLDAIQKASSISAQ